MPLHRSAKRSPEELAESARLSFEHKRRILRRYRKLGVEWGAFVGALIGVIGGGLQMRGWENPFAGWAAVTLSLAAVGGFIGYFFYDLLFGAQIRGALDAGGFGAEGGDAAGGGGGGDGGGGD